MRKSPVAFLFWMSSGQWKRRRAKTKMKPGTKDRDILSIDCLEQRTASILFQPELRKLMRIAVIVPVLFLVVAVTVSAQENLFTPMKGSATPEFQMSDTKGTCLVFGKHV